MGYSIRAFIGSTDALLPLAAAYPVAVRVPLAQGLCLIPLTDELYDSIVNEVGSARIAPFAFLTTQLEQQVLLRVGLVAVGYLEAEYFGGHGQQAALCWQNGQRQVWGPRQGAINALLAQLGVVTTRRRQDAFEAVGLSQHRYTEDWLPE
jgi:hypothetical protein